MVILKLKILRSNIYYYESDINKNGDLLTQFESINENDILVLERLADLPPQMLSTPHQKRLINNHTDVNKGKIKGYL